MWFVRCSNKLYTRNKSLTKEYSLLCLGVVDAWILDYLYPSPFRKLNSNVTGVKLYNGRWTQIVNDPHTNHHQTKQNVFVLIVMLVKSFSRLVLFLFTIQYSTEKIEHTHTRSNSDPKILLE